MDEFLPHYDVVITGTGLTQSIIAAATARIGKTVFHCDKNEFYSQEWQSMNFQQIINWCHQLTHEDNSNTTSEETNTLELNEGEVKLSVSRRPLVKNVFQISYLCENSSVEEPKDSDPIHVNTDEESGAVGGQNSSREQTRPQWSLLRFNIESRKFNLDLCPRLLFSRGSMVNLLVSSNIARYAEFKAITRILTTIDGALVEVPCSRGDIFNSKDVSVVEKRMLMKFMMFCSEYDKHYDQYKDYEQLPINQFLGSQNLSPILQKFILNAIAMTTEDCTTGEALKLIHKFIQSAGRFGNTPFLFTLYGTGELPQAFCRLCAVFGGTYCLKKKFKSIIVDQNNKCKAVVIDDRKFNCDFVVTDYSLNSTHSVRTDPKFISRAIIISDATIKTSDTEHLSLLHIEKSNDCKSSVYLIEVGSAALISPKGLYVQYLWCDSSSDNAKQDLLPVVKRLYNFTPETATDKPKVLWSVYYNQECTKADHSDYPKHIYTTTPPINELDFDFAINEARSIFETMFPNEEFLPRAPDPNEIVFDGQQNNDIEMAENNDQITGPTVNNDQNSNY